MRIMRSYTVLLSFVCLGGIACQNDTELNETTVLGAQSIHKGTVYASPVADVNLATIYERNFPGCTGVLLKGATPAVLTNAHCVAAYSDYGVSFGQKNGADFVMVPTKQVYPVSGDSAMHHSKRRLHSGFIDPKRAHLKSDIAVLFLEGAPGNMPGVTLDCTKTGPTLPKAVEVHAGTSLLSGSLASENVGFKNWGAFNIASDDSDVWNKGAFTILPNGYQHLINGDSGSPVYDPSTSKMVGLVYGGLEVHNGRTYNVGYALQIANFCEWLATDALDLDILASYSGDLDNNSQFETKLTVRRAGDNLVFALNSEVLGNASATMYGVDVAIDPAIAAVGDFVNATAQVAMMNEAGS